MQIQRVNMQSSIAQSKQNKAKGQPAFGMKFFMEKKLSQNISNSVVGYEALANGAKESTFVKELIFQVKNFMRVLPKRIAGHNANPDNHKLFNNNFEIEQVKIGFTDRRNNFYPLVNSSYDKFSSSDTAASTFTDFVDYYKKGRLPLEDLLSARIITNTGVEIETPCFADLSKDKIKFQNVVANLQESEIIKLERKNPDLYWDMIKPPAKQ